VGDEGRWVVAGGHGVGGGGGGVTKWVGEMKVSVDMEIASEYVCVVEGGKSEMESETSRRDGQP